MYFLGWGTAYVALSCWTGIPTPLVLGVEIGFAPRPLLGTLLGVVFGAVGSFCLQRFFARRKRILALQALYILLRHRLLLVRRLFRKSCSLFFFLLPFRRAGVRGRGVLRVHLVLLPWGFLSSRSMVVQRVW